MSDLGFVKAVSEWPARIFFAVAFGAAGLLLLSHSRWADIAGVAGAPEWFRVSLTAVTFVFFLIGMTKGLSHVAARRAASKAAREREKAWENELRGLTPDEGAVLARFVDGNVRVAKFLFDTSGPYNAVVAQALALRGHLYQVARYQDVFSTVIDYAIQEPTLVFLRQHPELLQSGRAMLAEAKKGGD